MLKKIAQLVLSALGWQLDSRLPSEKKYVIIGAFHTSNWDFPLGILGMWALGLKASWVGKHTLFRGPLGPIFKRMGGIPVDRSVRTGFIQRVAELYNTREEMALTIAAEGTRSKTTHWKTGFYFIALKAKVPIALGYIDYRNKRLGVGGALAILAACSARVATLTSPGPALAAASAAIRTAPTMPLSPPTTRTCPKCPL